MTVAWAPRIRLILVIFTLAAAALVIVELFGLMPGLRRGTGFTGALVILLAASTIANLCCQLPAQNVILGASIICLMGAGFHVLGRLTGLPFGVFQFTPEAGRKFFDVLPWPVPLLWLVLLLNSRGMTRVLLRPWRNTRLYGFWVLGVTVLLVVLLVLGLEPFATRVHQFWKWQPTKLNLNWYDTPEVNFLGWALCSLLILAFATPSLINKKVAKSKPDYVSCLLWATIAVLFVAGAVSRQLWTAAALVGSGALAVSAGALWNSRAG